MSSSVLHHQRIINCIDDGTFNDHDVVRKKCFWALLGHFCGDAAGATLEFMKGVIHEDKVVTAMHMSGGGYLNVGPGQITDDGELTIALYKTLMESSTNSYYPLNEVARAYRMWYKSAPFDCGRTCGIAFGGGLSNENDDIGMAMIYNSLKWNAISEANGALMRACPIAIWGVMHNHSPQQIAMNARFDAMLSHPNIVCQDANAIYCVTLAKIIENIYMDGNVVGFIGGLMSEIDIHIMGTKYCQVVVDWYNASKQIKKSIVEELGDCRENIGHVKHAFIMAMYFARKGRSISYEDGIREVLKCGGDTDTNAAICGAILGAIHGYVPQYMYKPVIDFDCVNYDTEKYLIGRKRPEMCSVAKCIETFLS